MARPYGTRTAVRRGASGSLPRVREAASALDGKAIWWPKPLDGMRGAAYVGAMRPPLFLAFLVIVLALTTALALAAPSTASAAAMKRCGTLETNFSNVVTARNMKCSFALSKASQLYFGNGCEEAGTKCRVAGFACKARAASASTDYVLAITCSKDVRQFRLQY
jgi:hypothetical protein